MHYLNHCSLMEQDDLQHAVFNETSNMPDVVKQTIERKGRRAVKWLKNETVYGCVWINTHRHTSSFLKNVWMLIDDGH